MYVEDVFISLDLQMRFGRWKGLNAWQRNFVISVGEQLRGGAALSINQNRIVMAILMQLHDEIVDLGLCDLRTLDGLLSDPVYRKPVYESAQVPREARHLGDNLLGLRCKTYAALATRIKRLSQPATDKLGNRIINVDFGDNKRFMRSPVRFDWPHKMWIVPVSRMNYREIMALLNEERFHVDAATSAYLDGCARQMDQPSVVRFADKSKDTLIVKVADDDIFASWIVDVAQGIVL